MSPFADDLAGLADEDYCYVTSTGRKTGLLRRIEIWFGLEGRTLYILSGGRDRADWVRNMRANPNVSVRIRDREFAGHARAVQPGEEDALARRLLVEKYRPRYADDLEEWGETAVPIAVDLAAT